MNELRTEQEKFWAGKFGDEYIDRNNEDTLLDGNMYLFSKVLSNMKQIKSMIEFGSNIGINLVTMKKLIPTLEVSAVEINEKAVSILKKYGYINIYHKSILNFNVDYRRDFVLIKGVLIHMSPDVLNEVYETLYHSSSRYVCIVEYYNLTPIEVMYRGNKEKLFKRDFAGEMLEKYKDLKLIDYGFMYHKDHSYIGEDTNWFLLEKVTNK